MVVQKPLGIHDIMHGNQVLTLTEIARPDSAQLLHVCTCTGWVNSEEIHSMHFAYSGALQLETDNGQKHPDRDSELLLSKPELPPDSMIIHMSQQHCHETHSKHCLVGE